MQAELLKYQQIDAQKRKIEAEIAGSEERKKAADMQNYLKDCQAKLQKLEGASETILRNYKRASAFMQDLNKRAKELNAQAKKANNEQVASIKKIVLDYVDKMSKIEKEASALAVQAKQIAREVETVMKNAVTAKKNYSTYKNAYDAVRASREPEIKKLQESMQEQKKKVDPKLMHLYEVKADAKTFPIFVPVKEGRCSGCHVELSAAMKKKLTEQKMVECENCGRYIYE